MSGNILLGELQVVETVPEGAYDVRIMGIHQKEGVHGDYLNWQFQIVNHEEHEGTTVYGNTSMTYSNRSKLYKWAKSLFKVREIPRTYALQTKDLIGRRASAVIEVQTGEDNTEYNIITKLLLKKFGDEEERDPKGLDSPNTLPFDLFDE